MKKSTEIEENTKPQFSGHETFSLRHGWLKKYFDLVIEMNQQKQDDSQQISIDQAIIKLGVGKNMLSSMKYWALAVGMINKENKINHKYQEILEDTGLDPWLENSNTLWFIHYQLATNPSLFLYYMFFNHINISKFDKDELKKFIKSKYSNYKHHSKYKYFQSELNEQTLEKDIDCFLRLYTVSFNQSNMSSKISDEEKIESPMTELLLIELNAKGQYDFKYKSKSNLSIYTFIYALLLLYKRYNANSINFDTICYDPNSPGRIFALDENAVAYYIQLLKRDWIQYFKWDETAGLKTLAFVLEQDQKQDDFIEKLAFDIFKKNYITQEIKKDENKSK
jgi:hypothetical protein